MLTSFATIFELSISMVTALLGLAYPLFIDKINGIAIMSLVSLKIYIWAWGEMSKNYGR